ncbi:MAG: hypothetical protein ACK47B_04085 [Armatimonadota bacterium]
MKTLNLDRETASGGTPLANAPAMKRGFEMNGRLVAVGLALVLVAGGGFALWRSVEAQRPKGSDAEQIRAMLAEGERATERLDAAGLGRFISDDYRDNLGLSDTSVKYQIRRYFREHDAIEVEIPEQSIEVNVSPNSDTGSVSFLARVGVATDAKTATYDLPMTLQVKKEPVHYYWLFPGEEWKVTSAEGYGALEGYQ